MQIGKVNLDERVLVVAEIGNNHEGDFERATELVRRAAETGVDAVKFQTFRTEHFVSASDAERFRRLKSFELTYAQFEELADVARSLGVLFVSTPLDLRSAEFLDGVVDAFKIASGDNDFYPLIDRVVRSGKPVIISSGSSDFGRVARTVAFVKSQWARLGLEGQLAILHCVSSYPVPDKEANLRAIRALAELPGVTVGYSDHTMGLDASVMAVALGARIIEKHFTLDKNLSNFRDHKLAADPAEMSDLVRRVRAATAMLGSGEKVIQPCEAGSARAIRRSVAAGSDLPAGHRLVWADLTWLRPAGGLPPGAEDVLVGKTLKRAVRFGEPLQPSDVE